MVGVFSRGKGLLDIDFMGGSSVTITFTENQDIGQVRETAVSRFLMRRTYLLRPTVSSTKASSLPSGDTRNPAAR